MRKYLKTEVMIVNIESNSNISNSLSNTVGGGNSYGINGTDNVTYNEWKDLFN